MINFNYDYSSIKMEDLKVYKDKIREIVKVFNDKKCPGNDYIGWYDYPVNIDEGQLNEIIKDAKKIRDESDVFVVCGIGGSYLGARAVIEAIKGYVNKDVEILYMGNTFDERYTKDVIDYLKSKDFSVNVISKSGSTLETAFAFRILKQLLEEKYGADAKSRIYVTTDAENGCLRKMVSAEGYKSYVVPGDVGGRYSVFTPVGLLPIAVANIDIKQFINGAKEAIKYVDGSEFEKNAAYQYASYRFLQYKKGKKVELFASYSPYLSMISEWWKQLFGESEGKEGKGLFPASVSFSTDLHSLGQFVQEGSKILFITQLKINGKGNLKLNFVEDDVDNLNYLADLSLNEINLIAQKGTNKAHHEIGGVDNFTFELDEISEFNIGMLLYLFMYSCMISAGLLGVNAFNQPGVEFYKNEMKKMLKKQ